MQRSLYLAHVSFHLFVHPGVSRHSLPTPSPKVAQPPPVPPAVALRLAAAAAAAGTKWSHSPARTSSRRPCASSAPKKETAGQLAPDALQSSVVTSVTPASTSSRSSAAERELNAEW